MNFLTLKSVMRLKPRYIMGTLSCISFLLGMADIQGDQNLVTKTASNGNTLSFWLTYTPEHVFESSYFSGSTQSWSQLSAISIGDNAYGAKIALATNGLDNSAIAVWLDTSDGVTALFGAMLPTSASQWTSAVQISSSLEEMTNEYNVSLNDTGEILLVWTSYETTNFTSQIRSSTSTLSSSNTWSTPITVSGS